MSLLMTLIALTAPNAHALSVCPSDILDATMPRADATDVPLDTRVMGTWRLGTDCSFGTVDLTLIHRVDGESVEVESHTFDLTESTFIDFAPAAPLEPNSRYQLRWLSDSEVIIPFTTGESLVDFDASEPPTMVSLQGVSNGLREGRRARITATVNTIHPGSVGALLTPPTGDSIISTGAEPTPNRVQTNTFMGPDRLLCVVPIELSYAGRADGQEQCFTPVVDRSQFGGCSTAPHLPVAMFGLLALMGTRRRS